MKKKLTKSRNDKMISGVCGGIGQYLEVDSTFVRLGVAACCFFSCGTVLIAYIAAALIIPYEDQSYYN